MSENMSTLPRNSQTNQAAKTSININADARLKASFHRGQIKRTKNATKRTIAIFKQSTIGFNAKRSFGRRYTDMKDHKRTANTIPIAHKILSRTINHVFFISNFKDSINGNATKTHADTKYPSLRPSIISSVVQINASRKPTITLLKFDLNIPIYIYYYKLISLFGSFCTGFVYSILHIPEKQALRRSSEARLLSVKGAKSLPYAIHASLPPAHFQQSAHDDAHHIVKKAVSS